MSTRYISTTAAADQFDTLFEEASRSGDEIVLEVEGVPVAKLVPLSIGVRNVIAREKFGVFWDEHRRWMAENPTELTEDEVMELINTETEAHRAEKLGAAERSIETKAISTRS